MAREQLAPGAVADLHRPVRRMHHVGEEDGRQHPVVGGAAAGPRQELLHLVEDLVGVDPRQVVVAGELHEAPAGDPLGDVATLGSLRVQVARPVKDKRRHPHGRQYVADVDRAVHEDQVARGARAGGGAAAGAPPPGERLVCVRRELAEIALLAPRPLDLGRIRRPFLARRRPGVVVVRILALGVGAVDDHRGRALGIRGREEDAHRSALGVAEERRPLDPLGVEDGAHVVHPRLEVGQAAWPVREAGAALVEPDEASRTTRGARGSRPSAARPSPARGGRRSRKRGRVGRALARHLVGDVDAVALRVAGLRLNERHRHTGHAEPASRPSRRTCARRPAAPRSPSRARASRARG